MYKNALIPGPHLSEPRLGWFIVKGSKFTQIGTKAEIPVEKNFAQEIDLGGNLVLPAFHDNHTHPIDSGVEFAECMLYDASSERQILRMIQECDQKASAGAAWLRGSGWAGKNFQGGLPHKSLLDNLGIKRPIALLSFDGHSYWVNSEAMRLAGLSDKTPDPRDGRIGRDATGKLNGVLYEGAMSFIDTVIPKRTEAQLKAGLKLALTKMHENGITSFKDAYVTEENLKIYYQIDQSGELKASASLAFYADSNLELDQIETFNQWKAKYSSPNLHLRTIKIYLDGVMEDKTAALLSPYLGSNEKGNIQWDKEKLKRFVMAADQNGYQLHFHAIGDAAVRAALDAIEEAQKKNSNLDHRHEIAHLQLIDPIDIARFQKLNVSAVFSPLWAVASQATEAMLGKERSKWLYPIGSVYKSAGPLAFGSDWSVTSMNPLEGIEVAINRKWPGTFGRTWHPSEVIDLKTAILAYTTNGARATFREKETGSIISGMDADFVVLGRNIFQVKTSRIGSTEVLATFRKGQKLFSKEKKN